ncbi:glutamate synthase large subunit [Ferrimonas balearica]|uniref:glutamate synthase large subunit n=1 Tax=Ferrimonas balearica TaxID=44012 RepID=UPI001C998655|nr:glutamate synthase large subunit [Ferrimonas balearica]MBY5922937.1 glutamate synthase large subunit [Ferrimonas balearica]MBY5997686.1 glutamate synthase large subunit [Ferrimonas balearica]
MALYQPGYERENCGFGLIAHMEGEASHRVVRTAISALDRLQHRGAIGADGKTGDGCGLLLKKPDGFFQHIASEQGWRLSNKYAVGMIMLGQDPVRAHHAKAILQQELERETLSVLGWRDVPVNLDSLGPIAARSVPAFAQVFINAPVGWRSRDLERRLYMARRRAEKQLADDPDFYVSSLSGQVIVYKGLMLPRDLPTFYPDLADLRMQSAICLFHQRFSTNTQPRWQLAQPFRYLAHNGEINTINGNRQWAVARQYKFSSPLLPDLQDAAPFVNQSGSDSSSLDNMLEMLLAGGMDIKRAMRLLIPPAWQSNPDMDADLKAFYDFNSMHMEPWDGPAGVVLTNGRHAACAVDRNGLRPSRYVITKDRILTLASEVGIWDYQPDEVVEKGRVGPGELLVLDTFTGKLLRSFEIDEDLKSRHPYAEWMKTNSRRLVPGDNLPREAAGQAQWDNGTLVRYQKLFNVSREELREILWPLAEGAAEAVGSMGDDTPMAVLSTQVRSLYDYFRQQFAQVTNPPIDPLREKHVMSLATCIGKEQNPFNETTGHANRVIFDSPVLLYSDFAQLRALDNDHYRSELIELNYAPEEGLAAAIERIADEAENAAREGATMVVLSDRDIAADKLPVPAVMAVGAVQRRLVVQQLRCDTNILVETGSARDPHHFAVLLGFGATAIYPYLAYESIAELAKDRGEAERVRDLLLQYRRGIDKGLLKILSKMGISTIASYRCSHLFEAVGLASDVIELCFKGVPARIEGADFTDIEADQALLHKAAFRRHQPLAHGGLLKFVHGGEYHCFNPDVVQTLQQAVNSGDQAAYDRYATLVDQRPTATLRDLLGLKPDQDAIAPDKVEGADQLYWRFDTAAMSIGALGPEAHEALAVAMNTLGGHSNSGEGGEDPRRFNSPGNSRIKQVASGRFGVTAAYLMSADVIQIKVAQGAKPGEGGQLPGHKVSAEIATLRFSRPGVTLISPPPHHDIYSIEDLAQLIFDLKQINPKARVSVKLVSEPGIGTIACGVAKANADMITVSGYDGGTGASPLTSIHYAGSPWELGLAEVQQALVANGLRHKVCLQVDGGLKSGLDVVKAALLGAESFGFGTAPMVALGCKYLRICHLNNCATGVATQDKRLRDKHYHGTPEKVMRFFQFVAEDVRRHMAALGVSEFNQMIGRSDWLTQLPGQTTRQAKLDLSDLLERAIPDADNACYSTELNPPLDQGELNQQMLQLASNAVAIKQGGEWCMPIQNTDRSVGATLSGHIAKLWGNQGMADQILSFRFSGTAGQSFGVWNVGGVRLELSGDANDYVGKGMTGGELIVRTPGGVAYDSAESVIIGNTCLYGATGGKLFASGKAGERFAVRNSGALAVVEGCGDNGCEYMTGGVVAILGQTGVNFGAGMTGGFAYVFDQHDDLDRRLNPELVEALPVTEPMIQHHLKQLLQAHLEATGSERAEELLQDLTYWLPRFKIVKPRSSALTDLLALQHSQELKVKAG